MSTEASTSAAAASAPIPSSIPNQSASPAPAPAKTDPPATAPGAATPETPAPAAQQPDLSRGFASLAAEERRIRTERDTLKAEGAKLATLTQQLNEARKDPRAAMRLLGFTDDQVFDALAGTQATPPAPEDRIARIEQTLAERDRQAQEAQQRAQQVANEQQADAVIQKFRSDTAAAIKAAGDKYALIQLNGAESEVTARIEKHLLDTGEFLKFETVADQVEAEHEARARKAAELPKLKLVPQSENRVTPPSEQRTTTLTNRGTSAPAAGTLPPLPLDPDARTAEILRRRSAAAS